MMLLGSSNETDFLSEFLTVVTESGSTGGRVEEEDRTQKMKMMRDRVDGEAG